METLTHASSFFLPSSTNVPTEEASSNDSSSGKENSSSRNWTGTLRVLLEHCPSSMSCSNTGLSFMIIESLNLRRRPGTHHSSEGTSRYGRTALVEEAEEEASGESCNTGMIFMISVSERERRLIFVS